MSVGSQRRQEEALDRFHKLVKAVLQDTEDYGEPVMLDELARIVLAGVEALDDMGHIERGDLGQFREKLRRLSA